jgi:hypothetical protein
MTYTEKQVEEILERVWNDRVKGGGWTDKQTFVNTMKQLKNCNLQNVMRCASCGNADAFTDGSKQQILIEEEYRYIYAVTCNECGKVCDVELFD